MPGATTTTTAAATGRLPTAAELSAWRALLRAHATVTRVLEAELMAAQGLALAEYDVLVQLAEAVNRQLRMTELADRVLLSRSGITRLVDRLERDGLVCRQACPSDARGTLAVLTAAGVERLRAAAPAHLRGVTEHVTNRFDAGELASLARLLERIAAPEVGGDGGCGLAGGTGG